MTELQQMTDMKRVVLFAVSFGDSKTLPRPEVHHYAALLLVRDDFADTERLSILPGFNAVVFGQIALGLPHCFRPDRPHSFVDGREKLLTSKGPEQVNQFVSSGDRYSR